LLPNLDKHIVGRRSQTLVAIALRIGGGAARY
jgi:hypothetical protein